MYYQSKASGKMRFNSIASIYEKGRPSYPSEIFRDILTAMENVRGPNKEPLDRILEIGSGTGQIVLDLCEMANKVDCIEPGHNLMSLLKEKFGSNSKIALHECEFEAFDTPCKYDLVVSANALHWIPREIVFPKSQSLLRQGGWLVGIWSQSVFHDDVYSVVTETFGKRFCDFCDSQYSDIHKACFKKGFDDFSKNWGFSCCAMKTYRSERVSTCDQLVDFIVSYTDLSGLSEEAGEDLISRLRKRIDDMGIDRHKCVDHFLIAMGQYA